MRYVKRVGEDFGKYKVGDYATLKGTVEDYDATSLDEEVELVDGSGRAAWWYKRYTKLMPEGFEPSASTPEAPVKSPERGERKNNGKNRLDLIPPEMIIALGEVLTFGASKYPDRNWEKGMPLTEIAASFLRHYVAWLKGADIDPESGKPHLWHMFTNVGFMVTISERMPQWDDRPSKAA